MEHILLGVSSLSSKTVEANLFQTNWWQLFATWGLWKETSWWVVCLLLNFHWLHSSMEKACLTARAGPLHGVLCSPVSFLSSQPTITSRTLFLPWEEAIRNSIWMALTGALMGMVPWNHLVLTNHSGATPNSQWRVLSDEYAKPMLQQSSMMELIVHWLDMAIWTSNVHSYLGGINVENMTSILNIRWETNIEALVTSYWSWHASVF